MGALDTRWVMWFHGTKNDNWTKDSYAIIEVVSTAREACALKNTFTRSDDLVRLRETAMLFWMREITTRVGRRRLVYPIWEDDRHSGGGAVCFGGPFGAMDTLFWCLVGHASCEAVYDDREVSMASVSGVSISPKRDGAAGVVKVWMSEARPVTSGRTPAEVARVVMSGWSPRLRRKLTEYTSVVEPYYVPHRSVKERDARNVRRTLQNEHREQRRLEKKETRGGRRRGGQGRRGRSRRGRSTPGRWKWRG